MKSKHQVVVVGGGFGGLHATRGLRHLPVETVLVDRCNYHLFQPLLYQLATGALSSGDITAQLRGIFKHDKSVRVLLGEVTYFDLDSRKVFLTDGEVPYDTLVVAAGAVTNYFGHDGWRERALGLKEMEDAIELRRRIFFAFEEAEKECDSVRRLEWLTFVIAGAGPTGVELAGALAEIARDTLRSDFRCINPAETHIYLVDGNDRPLNTYTPELSQKALKDLVELGVRFRPGVMVTDVTSGSVTLKPKNGSVEEIRARTVIWSAGVRGHPIGKVLADRAGIVTLRSGQIAVQPDCTLPGYPEVFVIGDLASLVDPGTGNPLPGTAPVAMQQGAYVARTIGARVAGRTTRPFRFNNRGNLATIGRNRAVANLGKLRFDGFLAWILWLFVHLAYLAQFTTRIVVFVQWGIQYATASRGSRIINNAIDLIASATADRNRDLPRETPAGIQAGGSAGSRDVALTR
ncbi:MAG: NAD(P)/FAD-dependent oxidoreductase [Bryobacteraceae bacterium]